MSQSTRRWSATQTAWLATVRPSSRRERVFAAMSVVSPLGWLLLGLALASWFAASRLGWQELAAATMGLGLLIAICAFFAIGRLDLDATIVVSPNRLTAGKGDRGRGELTVTNRRRRGSTGLRLELPIGHNIRDYTLARLGGGATEVMEFDVPNDKRAVLQVGPCVSVQGDPLGLFRRIRVWSDPQEVFIHPPTSGLPTLADGWLRDIEGQNTQELSPSNVAFHALREYVPGDDQRHIHWKSSAKQGTLMVRQYIDTRRSHMAIVLPTKLDEYADEDEFELAVSCAASMARHSSAIGQGLSVLPGTQDFAPAQGLVLLDQFSAISDERRGGGLADTTLRIRRTDATLSLILTGSALSMEEVRDATAWVHEEMMTVIVRLDASADPSYRVVGGTTVVTVPDLARLAAGLAAVAP